MKQAAADALRQAFMPKDEYESLRDEERAWNKLARPLLMTAVTITWSFIVVAFFIMVDIVFAVTEQEWPSCQRKRLARLDVVPEPSLQFSGDSRASYLLSEEEAAEYFWVVVFLPTSIVFGVAMVYLFAGIAVAYTAPERHPFLRVVENNCCASSHGGVRCLSLLNLSFCVVFSLMALFLGSSIITMETDCSVALFWCYEVVCWCTALLLAGTAFFLRRKAAVIMDVGNHYGSRTVGVELLEAPQVEPDHIVEKRIADGFRSWSGVLDSDDDEVTDGLTTGLDDVWEEDEALNVPADVRKHRIG